MSLSQLFAAASIDCPCIDASSFYEPLSNCIVNGTNGERGVWIYGIGHSGPGACYPLSYGSNVCKAHDADADPLCLADNPPDYCSDKWCWIDHTKCRDSEELYYLTGNQAVDHNPMFYSYSTCNSTNDTWEQFTTVDQLKNSTISVTIPGIWHPGHFKEGSNENDDPYGEAYYYDDDVQWKGWVIDYLEAVKSISDIGNFHYTYRTVGSKAIADSPYTAALGDIQHGISDLVASSLWITPQRLAMTAFTTETGSDKVLLWSPSPKVQNSGGYMQRVLEPFDPTLWLCLCGAVILVAILSILFATPASTHRKWYKEVRSIKMKEGTVSRRVYNRVRLVIDACISYFMLFFGHTTDYDIRASYPAKILNFGYGFLVLIAVAAYTANLAAFLTLQGHSKYIASMKFAIDNDITVCAPAVIQADLRKLYPKAEFEFYANSDHIFDLLDSDRCKAVIGSEFDLKQSKFIVDGFCDRNIVSTNYVAIEIPLGFPVSEQHAAGLSHWIEKAKKQGITFEKFAETYRPNLKPTCSLNLPEVERNLLTPLTPENFALPFIVLLCCCVLSLVIFIYQKRLDRIEKAKELKKRDARKSVMTAKETDELDVPTGQAKEDGDYLDPSMRTTGPPPGTPVVPQTTPLPGSVYLDGSERVRRMPRRSNLHSNNMSGLLDLAQNNDEMAALIDVMNDISGNNDEMYEMVKDLQANQAMLCAALTRVEGPLNVGRQNNVPYRQASSGARLTTPVQEERLDVERRASSAARLTTPLQEECLDVEMDNTGQQMVKPRRSSLMGRINNFRKGSKGEE